MVRSSMKRCDGRFFGQLKNDECSFFGARFGYFDDTISLASLNRCIEKKNNISYNMSGFVLFVNMC